jgi:hypothetical protein
MNAASATVHAISHGLTLGFHWLSGEGWAIVTWNFHAKLQAIQWPLNATFQHQFAHPIDRRARHPRTDNLTADICRDPDFC